MSPNDSQPKSESGVRRGLAQRLARVIHTILPRASHPAEGEAVPTAMGLPGQRILSGSAAPYQRLANRMSAMAFELAPDGAILFVDQTITAITGYGPDEILGRPWWDILFPGEQARQIPELLKRLRSGDVTGHDLVLTHKTGMLVTLGLNTANYYDPDGTLQTIVGWAVDRTQHRRAEAKARAVADTLGERVKELTALHGAMRILQNEDKPIPDVLNEVLAILPHAWRYPDVAVARIVWDDQTYATPDFTSTPWMQRAKLTTTDGKHGAIEIGYLQYSSAISEPPFLAEEISLLNSLAEMLRSFLQRRQAIEALRRTRDELENSREEVLARLRHSKAEARARADELATLMDALPVYTLIAQDAECSQIVGNQEVYRLVGLPAGANLSASAEGQGAHGTNALQNERALTTSDLPMQQVTRTGQPLRNWEMTMVGQDGASRDVLGNVVPLFDETGQVRGAIGAFLDITELRRTHATLAENEARMRAMLEHLPVGVWFADGRGQITYGNEAGRRIWAGTHDMGPDQFTGYKAWWRDTGRLLAPEDWAIARAVRTGQSSLGELLEIECFDGTHKIIRNSAIALVGAAGELTGVVVLNEDVTEATRREEAHREARERLRLATTAAGLGVFEWDVAADQALWENERMYEIFGRQREEGALTKAELVAQILDPDDVEGFERDLVEGMQPDRFFISTCRIHRGNDSAWRCIEFLGRFTLAPDGRPLRLVGTVTDITDRRQALESLRESETRLAFVLDVSQMGYWELDLLNHTTRRSLRHDQIFGYGELLPSWTYEMFLEHVVPKDRERVDGAFKMAVEQGRDWDIECRITCSNGALRWIWACGRLRHDESGQPRRLVGIVLDITARKRAEEEHERLLQENSNHREFLEQLMQALPVGVAVVDGPDYRFEFVNSHFEAAAGLALPGGSNTAMVGRAYADALPHMASRGIVSLLDQARLMGKTASVHEFGVTMAPGREETYWNVDHVPLHDRGRADRILILVSEVTAQVQARKQIEQRAARDETILNNPTEGVTIADE